MKRALLIMAKRPRPGHAKTRLCPPLSHESAAKLSHCFLQDMVEMARAIPGITRFLAVWPIHDLEYFQKLAPDFQIVTQAGASLSQRLDHVMALCSGRGYEQVVAVNGDSPTLPPSYVASAFDALEESPVDVVLGPTEDGGYYLIGWRRPNSRLIRGVTMSTTSVLHDTMKVAAQENLKVAFTPKWYDVDEKTDLARLRADLRLSGDLGRKSRRFLDDLPWEENDG